MADVQMQTIEIPRLKRCYYKLHHPSGLMICLYPCPEFNSTYALFSTQYGSVDCSFKQKGETDYITVPDGIAHFLEHKLFQNQDGQDAFELFARTGASANAYTSFEKTSYLFSCTDHFEENLKILLSFVTSPYFTEESIAKEQGIIGQEIQMYEDDPSWKVFFNLLNCLYHNHPIKTDIAGTADSIEQITPELLYRCYHTFYNLGNMVLSIAGNFDPDSVLALCNQVLRPQEPVEILTDSIEEPKEVVADYAEEAMDLSIPYFQVGYKLQDHGKLQNEKNELYAEILLDLVAGEASPLYRQLYDSGLVNDAFDTEVLCGRDFQALIFSGESRDCKETADRIHQELLRLDREGIPKEDFLASKKALYGRYVRVFNSISATAGLMSTCQFAGLEMNEVIELVASARPEDLLPLIKECIGENRRALSVIQPLE